MRRVDLRILSGLAAALAFAAGPARADYMPFQGYVEMPNNLAPMVMGNLASENLRHLNEHYAHGGATRSAAGPSTLAPPVGTPTGPRELAASFPPERRPEVEHAFGEALQKYHQLESRFGIPANDVAGAMAAYIAGSYMTYRNVDLPDARFKVLVAQMRDRLQDDPQFARSSPAMRRGMYEQMAIIGTLMAVNREAVKRQATSSAAAENIRHTAKVNLESFLKTDADRVVLTDRGMEIH